MKEALSEEFGNYSEIFSRYIFTYRDYLIAETNLQLALYYWWSGQGMENLNHILRFIGW